MGLVGHIDSTSFPPMASPPGLSPTSTPTSSGSMISTSALAAALAARSAWFDADHRTIAQITQSIEIDIRMEVVHHATAREMREHIRRMFELSSKAREYAIVQDLSHVHQGDRSVMEYISVLRSHWRLIDSMAPSDYPTCKSCQCSVARAKEREKLRIF